MSQTIRIPKIAYLAIPLLISFTFINKEELDENIYTWKENMARKGILATVPFYIDEFETNLAERRRNRESFTAKSEPESQIQPPRNSKTQLIEYKFDNACKSGGKGLFETAKEYQKDIIEKPTNYLARANVIACMYHMDEYETALNHIPRAIEQARKNNDSTMVMVLQSLQKFIKAEQAKNSTK